MSNSSLPVEILEAIFLDLISEYTDVTEFRFLPRWYIVPLLRVCKLWHLVSERYLYRSISIGRRFAHDTLQEPEQSEGRGNVIAYKLIEALAANTRLAALVEEFELVAKGAQVYWSRKASLLFDICPNLKHVDLRGFSPYHLGEMIKSLKERSLVSFRLSIKKRGFNSFPIYELMRKWPRLQTIQIDGICKLWFSGRENPSVTFASEAFNCCPELREINFTRGYMANDDLKTLRFMCSGGVTRLRISVAMKDDAELVECLNAWSSTLRCVRLHIGGHDSPIPRLPEVLSALRRLEELQIHDFDVGFGALYDLPQPKRLCYNSILTDEALGHLSYHLENKAKFPALEHLVVYARRRGNGVGKLGDLCVRRNIKLQMWDGNIPLPSLFCNL